MGLPPTGKSVTVSGADFIRVAGGKIQTVDGYFDSRAVPDQLGLQVLVQPKEIGPFAFGNSTRVWGGKNVKPGAFSMTVLEARSPEEIQAVQRQSQGIVQEMLAMNGFLGFVGVTVGNRMMTISAWETRQGPAATAGRRRACGGDEGVLRHGTRLWRIHQRMGAGPDQCALGSLWRVPSHDGS